MQSVQNNLISSNITLSRAKSSNKIETMSNGAVSQGYCEALKGKNLSLLMFCGGISKASEVLSEADRKEIQSVLDNCRYTKMPVISNYNDINLTKTKNGIFLGGFDTPDTETINGVCGELTPKVIRILNERMKGKMVFGLVTGHCQKYNMEHAFIIAFKDTQQNRQKLESITDSCKKLADTVVPLYKKIQEDPEIVGNPEFQEEMMQIQSLAEKLAPKQDDLKNAVVIDPAFALIVDANKDGTFDGYQIHVINKLENAEQMNEAAFNLFGETAPIPLGYLKEVAPELRGKYPDNALLFMNFNCNSEDEPTKLKISILEDENCFMPEGVDELIESLPENHVLRKFVDKINSQVAGMKFFEDKS